MGGGADLVGWEVDGVSDGFGKFLATVLSVNPRCRKWLAGLALRWGN